MGASYPYLPALAPIMPWGPAIDASDSGLRALPLELIKRGDFNRVSEKLRSTRVTLCTILFDVYRFLLCWELMRMR